MKKNSTRKLLSLLLCIVLIAAMALCMIGCGDKNEDPETYATVFSNGDVLGQGAVKFNLTVVDLDGSETKAQISTDKTTVGEALLELGLIEGEEGPYGLYISAVNGIPYEYKKDGAYWSFYINGEYALTGVDSTNIAEGTTYTLKAEKA